MRRKTQSINADRSAALAPEVASRLPVDVGKRSRGVSFLWENDAYCDDTIYEKVMLPVAIHSVQYPDEETI
jgi:hypothetical protein